MKYEFQWEVNAGLETMKSAEDNIRKDQESGHSPISVCHKEGTAIVILSSPDPLQTTFVGNIKCCCGKVRGVILGHIDGSSITYQVIEN